MPYDVSLQQAFAQPVLCADGRFYDRQAVAGTELEAHAVDVNEVGIGTDADWLDLARFAPRQLPQLPAELAAAYVTLWLGVAIPARDALWSTMEAYLAPIAEMPFDQRPAASALGHALLRALGHVPVARWPAFSANVAALLPMLVRADPMAIRDAWPALLRSPSLALPGPAPARASLAFLLEVVLVHVERDRDRERGPVARGAIASHVASLLGERTLVAEDYADLRWIVALLAEQTEPERASLRVLLLALWPGGGALGQMAYALQLLAAVPQPLRAPLARGLTPGAGAAPPTLQRIQAATEFPPLTDAESMAIAAAAEAIRARHGEPDAALPGLLMSLALVSPAARRAATIERFAACLSTAVPFPPPWGARHALDAFAQLADHEQEICVAQAAALRAHAQTRGAEVLVHADELARFCVAHVPDRGWSPAAAAPGWGDSARAAHPSSSATNAAQASWRPAAPPAAPPPPQPPAPPPAPPPPRPPAARVNPFDAVDIGPRPAPMELLRAFLGRLCVLYHQVGRRDDPTAAELDLITHDMRARAAAVYEGDPAGLEAFEGSLARFTELTWNYGVGPH